MRVCMHMCVCVRAYVHVSLSLHAQDRCCRPAPNSCPCQLASRAARFSCDLRWAVRGCRRPTRGGWGGCVDGRAGGAFYMFTHRDQCVDPRAIHPLLPATSLAWRLAGSALRYAGFPRMECCTGSGRPTHGRLCAVPSVCLRVCLASDRGRAVSITRYQKRVEP